MEPETPDHPLSPAVPASLGRDHGDIFFAAVETTRMPMIVTDARAPDNPILFANNAFLAMTGYTAEEVIGSNCRFLQGPETDPAVVASVRAAIAGRREIAAEILNYRKNGSTFWNAIFISPVFDSSGELRYFFGSQLDVSRRRDAEGALRQAQKMEALGQLTGGIAHDFNNLLQVMTGYLELTDFALSRPELDRARMRRSLENVRGAVSRAATLTQQHLAFARRQRLDGRVLNLNSLVEGLQDMARRTLGEDIALTLDLAPDLGNCRLDTTQAEVALLNILSNARDAVAARKQGRIVIRTREVEIGAGEADETGGLAAGAYVQLAITDNGAGMPPEILERVMDPFFTIKEEGKGTGLGLSTVFGFARQSGGALRIRSEPDQGTTVALYFPRQPEEERPAPQRASRVVDHPGTEHILVVDDRPEVAELARAILEDFGYTVLTASDGREALQVLDRAGHVDMLFSDLIMPGGMNGVMLAREALRRQPRLKVLLTTGYAEASLERTDAGGSEFDLIDKPYGRLDLARRVRRILDGSVGVE